LSGASSRGTSIVNVLPLARKAVFERVCDQFVDDQRNRNDALGRQATGRDILDMAAASLIS